MSSAGPSASNAMTLTQEVGGYVDDGEHVLILEFNENVRGKKSENPYV
jgi:hypothetical protein